MAARFARGPQGLQSAPSPLKTTGSHTSNRAAICGLVDVFIVEFGMQVLRIPKGNGKVRVVYAPSEEEKAELRSLLPALVKIAKRRCNLEVVHGFMPGRSPLTNALPHVGYQYTVNMDLQDFFDTVLITHVMHLIPPQILAKVMRYGAARQGLPTSPLVANIAAAQLDWDLVTALPEDVVYTRYADDLSFSFDDQKLTKELPLLVTKTVEDHGFAVNKTKTKVQWAGAGRRIITGIAVDHARVFATREVRRKLRAAHHQNNKGSKAGLTEWCRLKLPALYLAEQKRRGKAHKSHHRAEEPTVEKSNKERRSLRL